MSNKDLRVFVGIILFAVGGSITFLTATQVIMKLFSYSQAAASGFASFFVVGVGLWLIVKSILSSNIEKDNTH